MQKQYLVARRRKEHTVTEKTRQEVTTDEIFGIIFRRKRNTDLGEKTFKSTELPHIRGLLYTTGYSGRVYVEK